MSENKKPEVETPEEAPQTEPEKAPTEEPQKNADKKQKNAKSQNQEQAKRTNDHHWVRGNGKSNYRWRYTYESTDESVKKATKARAKVGRVFHCYASDIESLAQRILKNTYATIGAVPLAVSYFNGKVWEEFEEGIPAFVQECFIEPGTEA